MARIRRRGGSNYRPSVPGTLPPTGSVFDTWTELDTPRSRVVSDVLTGAWGRAPIQAEGEAWRPRALSRITQAGRRRLGLRGRLTLPLAERVSLGRANLRLPAIRVPRLVKFCRQRKERREVLFAMRRAGFSGSAPKRHYRRTPDSLFGC